MLRDVLKRLRKQNGITQEQLAKAIGVERSSIGKYEGKQDILPSYDVLVRLANYFGVTINYLLDVPEPETHFSAKEVQDAFAARPQTVSTDPWGPENMDYAEKENDTIRILARGVTKLSPENRQKLLDVARVMFAEDFDEQGNKR